MTEILKLTDDNDDSIRSAAMLRLGLFDIPIEERFDRITRLACIALNVPIAAISLIERRRVWFKSMRGLAVQELPREAAVCNYALGVDGPAVIPDLSLDARFHSSPLVGTAPHINFYASYPVHCPDGTRIGGLCVMDSVARHFDYDMQCILGDLAQLVESELQISAMNRAHSALTTDLDAARRQLLRDGLTQTWNRAGILEILQREHSRARRNRQRLGVALVDLDHFKQINDSHGHLIGDRVLRTAADRMVDAVRPYDAVGRYAGEEFLVVIVEQNRDIIHHVAERIRSNISSAPVTADRRTFPITASVGVACIEPQPGSDVRQVVQAADEALYCAKRQGRNRVVAAA